MNYPKENPNAEVSNTTTAAASPTTSTNRPVSQSATDSVARHASHDAQHAGKLQSALPMRVPRVTLRTIVMAICVAMGGFIFGYDTGQISGFLEMQVFLERFGQPTTVSNEHPSGFYFTNVRSGLIVALVSQSQIILCYC